MSARDLDRVDDFLDLRTQVVGDRGGPGRIGGRFLSLFRDDELLPGLDHVHGLLVLVGRADEVVGDEDDRVGTGLGGVAGEVEGEIAFVASFDLLRSVDDLGRGFGGELDELVADLDLGGVELTDGGGIRVADGTVGVRNRLDDAVGALSGLAAVLLREVSVDLGVPRLIGGGLEVLGEVLGGARVVGTVDCGGS